MRHSFSASQLAVAEDCIRKWGWVYIEGVEGEENEYARFGKDVHEHVAKWLTDRQMPPDTREGKVASVIIPHLPAPQAVHPQHVEYGIEFSLADIHLEGFVDLYMPVGPNRWPRVYDHKTTSDIEQWGLKAEEFPDDIQATIYAAWALIRSGAEFVELQWTYAERTAKKTEPVVFRVNGAMIEPRLKKSIELARKLHEIRQIPDVRALDLPYNATACEHYGGCPFRELCNLTPQERMRAAMSQATLKADDYLAELRARKNGQTTSQPINPPVTTTPTTPSANVVVAQGAPVTAGGPTDVLAKMRARKAAEASVAQAPAALQPAVAQAPAAAVVQLEAVAVESVAEPDEPKRGRPRKGPEALVKSPRVQWAEYASTALATLINRPGFDVLVDEEREAIVQLSTTFADRLMAELDQRYPA